MVSPGLWPQDCRAGLADASACRSSQQVHAYFLDWIPLRAWCTSLSGSRGSCLSDMSLYSVQRRPSFAHRASLQATTLSVSSMKPKCPHETVGRIVDRRCCHSKTFSKSTIPSKTQEHALAQGRTTTRAT